MSEDTAAEAEAKKSGGKLKLILIIVLPLLCAARRRRCRLFHGHGAGPERRRRRDADAAAGRATPADVVFVDLPDMLVNLNAGGHRLRFLKIAAALEVRGDRPGRPVRQFCRASWTASSCICARSGRGAGRGRRDLPAKEELMARVNDAVHPAQVSDVLVKEMLVQ